MIIFVLGLLLCAFSIPVFICFKNAKLFARILLCTGIFISLLSLCFFITLTVAISYNDFFGYCSLAAFVLLFLTLTFTVFEIIKKKYIWIPIICLSFIVCLSPFVYIGVKAQIDSIPEMPDRTDMLSEYAPFEQNSKVALLESPSKLTLTDGLPVLDGATALFPVYSAFAKAVYPDGYNEKVLCHGTTDAYKAIVDKECDIAFVAAPSQKQLGYAKEKGIELEMTPIGYEAFVFFVNSKNPINELSTSDIKDIYSGRVTKWSEFGVFGLGKIKAFQRDEGSGSQSALIRFMGDDTIMEAPYNVINDMTGIIKETADYKNYKSAIGFSFRFYSTEMVKNNQIKLLSLDGVYPSRENIENGSYPITNCFYMVTRKGEETENVKRLMEWIKSEQGMELIDKTGYTPVNY